MANHDRAAGRDRVAQLDQAAAQLALIEEQLARIEMIAPFDGIIVSGDLSQKLGAPVERGQVLFEIAPLDGFRIALQVEEHDFADVALGQHGELAVASIPRERFPFTVTKVTAVNSAKDGHNRFRVEARARRRRPGACARAWRASARSRSTSASCSGSGRQRWSTACACGSGAYLP